MKRTLIALLVAFVPMLTLDPAAASEPPSAFAVSYAAGSVDVSGRRLGGTEIRALVSHSGMLFAANGYWKDRPGFLAATPGARILVLEAASGRWRVDHEFDERVSDGRRRHLAISALQEVTFHSDPLGVRLPAPVSVLLASTWDVSGRRTVFARDDRTRTWAGTMLAEGRPTPGFLPQIRTFGFHRDRRTGADLVFAGDSTGIFVGGFDPATGGVKWTSTPEFSTPAHTADNFPGLSGRLRISSFTEAEGRLFAAIGQQVWVRRDLAEPRWQCVYSNPVPGYSQTGLRGLTAVSEPGKGQFLLAAVEGGASRIVRIDPRTAQETTDLDIKHYLDTAWGTRVSYVIAAYNDMVQGPAGDLLIGLEAFIPPAAPRPRGHVVLDVIYGLEAGAWFLIRHPGGQYELHQVTARFPEIGLNLVAARSFAMSPFASEAGMFYVGGYDANDTPAHDTAWIARGSLDRR